MKTFVKGLDIDDVEQRATEAAALVDAARAAQKAYADAPEIDNDTEYTALHEANEACVVPLASLAAAIPLLIAEVGCLRDATNEGLEAKRILAELMRRTYSEGPVDGTGFGATGIAVDITMEVLLGHLDNPAVVNLVSFEIVKCGEKKAIVTVQRPTGKTPSELMRAANDERDALKLDAERLRTALAIADVERIGIHRMLDEARIARTEPETTLRGRVQAVLDVLKTAEAQAKR